MSNVLVIASVVVFVLCGLMGFLVALDLLFFGEYKKLKPKRKRKKGLVEIDKHELKELRENLEAAERQIEENDARAHEQYEYMANREVELAQQRARDFAANPGAYATGQSYSMSGSGVRNISGVSPELHAMYFYDLSGLAAQRDLPLHGSNWARNADAD